MITVPRTRASKPTPRAAHQCRGRRPMLRREVMVLLESTLSRQQQCTSTVERGVRDVCVLPYVVCRRPFSTLNRVCFGRRVTVARPSLLAARNVHQTNDSDWKKFQGMSRAYCPRGVYGVPAHSTAAVEREFGWWCAEKITSAVPVFSLHHSCADDACAIVFL